MLNHPTAVVYIPAITYNEARIEAEEATVYIDGVFQKASTREGIINNDFM